MILRQLTSYDTDDINSIQSFENEINRLMAMVKAGIINDVDVVISELRKKEFKLKEQKVLSVHKNKISEITVAIRGQKEKRWQTRLGTDRPRHKKYEDLIDNLYNHYFEGDAITDYSFNGVFEAALKNKIKTENPKEKTVRDYNDTYKAWIDDAFGKMDIRKMKPSYISSYMLDKVIEREPRKKYFFRFKGLLNLVFGFACDPERRIIDFNPVPVKNAVFARYFMASNDRPEDKAYQPQELELIRKRLWERIGQKPYDVYGYAILFSSETGLREGEIPSLKWADVNFEKKYIHIHSQQNDEKRDGKRVYYYNPTTKNEKGLSRDGRKIPITDTIMDILSKLAAVQEQLGIKSEWVFCKKDGSWINTACYSKNLQKLAKELELRLSNNHAFRIALNSYVYVPMGLPVTERARILGHSVETNLKHYTFSRTDDYNDTLCDQINEFNRSTRSETAENGAGTSRYLKILPFEQKRKMPSIR